jgi:hypothetical protein
MKIINNYLKLPLNQSEWTDSATKLVEFIKTLRVE